MVWGGGVFLFSDNEYKNGNNEKIKNWSRSVFVSGVHCGLLVDLSVQTSGILSILILFFIFSILILFFHLFHNFFFPFLSFHIAYIISPTSFTLSPLNNIFPNVKSSFLHMSQYFKKSYSYFQGKNQKSKKIIEQVSEMSNI